MSKKTLYLLLALSVAMSACGNNKQGNATDVSSANCQFVSTKDNSPLSIIAAPSDSDAAKAFLASCINPYTKLYAEDAEAAKQGKKQYAYQGCSGCHGGNANGLMGPSLIDAKWHYAKHISDKGMFETIAGGTNGSPPEWGSMLIWHNQVAGHTGEGLDTDTILKIIAWLRTQYVGGGETPWLNN
jgi:cytochrome c-L